MMTEKRASREFGSRLAWVAAILAIIAVGAYLRFRNLGQIPPGLHFDEAANGMDGLNVWKGQLHIFFPANNGREPLFLYLVAVGVRICGNTAVAVRLPAAMVGTLAIAATYALGRGLFRDWRALMAAGLVAVTFWTVTLSRISYRANTLLVLFPLWLLSFWRCRDRDRLAPYLLAGFMLG
jgi:predicted membrane-bound mannosyltransferase